MSTTQTEVRSTLLDLFREAGFDPSELADETRLREDLGIDSTELVEIAVAIERRVPISIDGEELVALDTFGEVVELVESASPGR
jgi:acyl carrier protein